MAKKTKMKISPQGMQKIAKHFGYKGDMAKFKEYLSSDPAKQHLMNRYYDKARKLYAQAGGAVVGYAPGGVTQEQQQAIDKLAAYGSTTKGSGGDYSNPESFKNYQFNDPNFQYEDLVKTIEQAGAGKENKIASDLNVKHGAGSGSFKFDDNISTQPLPVIKPGEDGKGTPVEQVNPIEKGMQDMAKNPTLTGEQKVSPTKITVTDDQLINQGTGQLTGEDPQATFKKADAEDDIVAPTAKKAETVDPTKSKEKLTKNKN